MKESRTNPSTTQRTDVGLTEALPWDRLEGDEDGFLIECYNCIGYLEPKGGYRRIQYGEVSAIITTVELEVPPQTTLRIKALDGDQLRVGSTTTPACFLPEGTYILLAIPVITSRLNDPKYEYGLRASTESVVGLITAAEGRLASLDRLYTGVIRKNGSWLNATEPITLVVQSPPAVGGSRLKELAGALAEVAEPTKGICLLALRWSNQAMRSSGTDSFLKAWYALELIGNPAGSKIRPIEDRLQTIYGFDRTTTHQKFKLGRILDLRGRIVHNGEMTVPHPRLANYVLAVFTDLLFDILGLPLEHRALSMLDDPKSPQDEWLP